MRARQTRELHFRRSGGAAISPSRAIANLRTFVLAWQRHVDIAQSRAGFPRRYAPLLRTFPLFVENGDVRKTITAADRTTAGHREEWLNLSELASVEITSEHPDYPIEGAL